MGPKKIKSTILSEAEEEAIVMFREMTELPALQSSRSKGLSIGMCK